MAAGRCNSGYRLLALDKPTYELREFGPAATCEQRSEQENYDSPRKGKKLG